MNIVIIGSGLVGLTQGIAFAEKGISVTLIDSQKLEVTLEDKFDGRNSAITWRSHKLMDKIGIWKFIAPHAEPIKDIRVSEFGSNLFLHFDHTEIAESGKEPEPFGFMVENKFIRSGLSKRAKELPNLKILAPAQITKIDAANSTLEVDGEIIHYSLLIGADGKNSFSRKTFGIEAETKDYKQTAIVCAVEHEKPHEGLALEHFLPAGPFAVLPMQDKNGKHYSSLVWIEPTDLAPIYLKMNDEEFLAEIEKRLTYLGKLKVISQRWSYPLTLSYAKKYVSKNFVLIGDSGHAIHPIAGQGVNLGFRDVEEFTEVILSKAKLGLAPSQDDLKEYEKKRLVDNSRMITATDKLNSLFSNNITPIKLARQVGLGAVNRMPRLRKAFMKYASGRK